MKYSLYSVFACLVLLMACGKKDEPCTEKIDPQCVCDQIYAPVCGCNGITYGNACTAECANITEYTTGSCNVLVQQSIIGDWEFLGYITADGINFNEPAKKHIYDAHIEFTDEKLSNGDLKWNGKSSINFIGGNYKITNNVLLISDLLLTEIAGDDAATAFENKFLRHLLATLTYTINNKTLLITAKGTGVDDTMVFLRK